MIAVLCTREKSIYGRLGADTWPKSRDAFQFAGPNRVIAHPPCRCWSQLRHLTRLDETTWAQEIALGLFCLKAVETFGGVLEHPEQSGLWTYANSPADTQSITFDQHWFGHPARKRTRLYAVGLPKAPAMDYRLGEPARGFDNLTHAQRNRTPLALAQYLLTWCKS